MTSIRVSLATAALLGLKHCRVNAEPTTLYFMLPEPCHGGCRYCNQKNGYLSRVRWPEFDFSEVNKKVQNSGAQRICIQCPYHEHSAEAAAQAVRALDTSLPVSLSIHALTSDEMSMLREAGVERVGMGLDCATEAIFSKWKRDVPSWHEYKKSLYRAKRIFGDATCHLMVGLGEDDEDIVAVMREMAARGIRVALFAYFRGNETAVARPRYRALQIARHAIETDGATFSFEEGRLVEMEVSSLRREAFLTSGCPGCNRPFYNERVTKIYNHPCILNDEQAKRAFEEAQNYAKIHCTAE